MTAALAVFGALGSGNSNLPDGHGSGQVTLAASVWDGDQPFEESEPEPDRAGLSRPAVLALPLQQPARCLPECRSQASFRASRRRHLRAWLRCYVNRGSGRGEITLAGAAQKCSDPCICPLGLQHASTPTRRLNKINGSLLESTRNWPTPHSCASFLPRQNPSCGISGVGPKTMLDQDGYLGCRQTMPIVRFPGIFA